jgi:hypothetical protein
MSRGNRTPGRRRFLLSAAAGVMAPADKPAVAAIVTEYRYYSHADVITGRILEGYSPNGVRVKPRTRVVSMYTDQVPANDMSRGLSASHGFRICPTVREALTLGSGGLAVDAVLLIGEHGNYASNDRGQKLYPRHELFRQVIEVFRESRRSVPLFCDKHLSYSWEKASQMYRWARELRFPFMAGSSVPVTIRKPELEIPLGARIEQAVSVGYGDLDAYGFHTLEGLQCMVERRLGGETGIAAVEWLEGDAVWKWRAGDGRWSAPLLEAALATGGRVKPGTPEQNCKRPVLFVLEYRDGLRAASYLLEGHLSEFQFAARLAGRSDSVATRYVLGDGPRPLPHFDGLVKCIEDLFVSRKPVYPVERTLLTTGALVFLFESRAARSRVRTSELNTSYQAPENAYFERA